MARTDNLNNFLTDVANSLRAKTETTGKISASEFDKVIANIETGSEPVLQEKTIEPTTSKQIVTPDSDYDGLSKVTVSGVTNTIDSNIQPSNIKKGVSILGIPGNLEEGIAPTGTLDITNNGVYDVSEYANANVIVGTQEITKGFVVNEYGIDGYAKDITLIGMTSVPSWFFGSYSTTEKHGINKYLQKVTTNDATLIGTNSFQYCQDLQTIIAPNATQISTYAFLGCTKLENLNCPKLTKVNNYAFRNCYELKTAELPAGITSIGQYSFDQCMEMELLKLPSNLISMGTGAFKGCTMLAIKEIPSGITSIPSECFRYCSALTEITALGNLTQISANAFAACSKLEKFVLPNVTSVPTLTSSALSSTGIAKGTGYIYVPDSLVEDFKIASGWSTYDSQIKGLSELE